MNPLSRLDEYMTKIYDDMSPIKNKYQLQGREHVAHPGFYPGGSPGVDHGNFQKGTESGDLGDGSAPVGSRGKSKIGYRIWGTKSP